MGVGPKKPELRPPTITIDSSGHFSGTKTRHYTLGDGSKQTDHYGFKGKFKKHGKASGYFWLKTDGYPDSSDSCPFQNDLGLRVKSK